jgi:hypothetical protein
MYEKYLAKVKQGLDERMGEPVLAFGLFLPHGSMMMMASPLASMIQKRESRKAAGGRKLPKSMALAVTPTSIAAFGVKASGYTGKGRIEEEVGRWPREGTQVDSGGGSVLNRLNLRFADGTRLELEVINVAAMRRINEEFVRIVSG